MRKKNDKKKFARPKARLGLPDLDQSKAAVLGSLRSPESQRGYRHSIEEFIDWYCSEPRLLSTGQSFSSEVGQAIQLACAIAQLFCLHAHALQQREPQVGLRCLGIYDMPAGFDRTIAAAQQHARHVF